MAFIMWLCLSALAVQCSVEPSPFTRHMEVGVDIVEYEAISESYAAPGGSEASQAIWAIPNERYRTGLVTSHHHHLQILQSGSSSSAKDETHANLTWRPAHLTSAPTSPGLFTPSGSSAYPNALTNPPASTGGAFKGHMSFTGSGSSKTTGIAMGGTSAFISMIWTILMM